jgi:hypothetical protein
MQIHSPEYANHHAFSDLSNFADFYRQLSMSVFRFSTMGTSAVCNIDSYLYSSIEGTLRSIRETLAAGRMGDAYTLLRRYYDSTVINIYATLYLRDHFSLDQFVVERIQKWLSGDERLPEYRVMSQYIRSSKQLQPINDLLYATSKYKLLRDRCNDLTHYNFFEYVLLNDGDVYVRSRGQWLDNIAEDARDIFVMHLGSVFFLSDHYMMSSDYLDALDFGERPEDGCQYWVAPFVQETFDKVIGKVHPALSAVIKAHTSMQL